MKKFALKEPSNPFARAFTLLFYGIHPLVFLVACAVGAVLLVSRTGRLLKNLTVRSIGQS